MKQKAAISLEGLDPKDFEQYELLPEDQKKRFKGIGGDKLVEPVPDYQAAACEKVISGDNNTWIILGRDRPKNVYTGYGGTGDTGAGSIDIVVGRMSQNPIKVDSRGNRLSVDPMFREIVDPRYGIVSDAARIHISQRTDIDYNFALTPGSYGTPEPGKKPRSGIGILADNTRIMARESIKIVTGIDDMNSMGGKKTAIYGVDIIANNDDTKLQPMVLGDNLVAAMSEMVNLIDSLTGIVDSFLMSQMTFNAANATHFHASPFFGAPTTPSPILAAASIPTLFQQTSLTKTSILFHKVNLATTKANFLQKFGARYINSKYNKVN